jgi:hypothetical protein
MGDPKIDMKIHKNNVKVAHTGPESAFCPKKQKNTIFSISIKYTYLKRSFLASLSFSNEMEYYTSALIPIKVS